MIKYFKDSFKKFKADALSKGIYDTLKWLAISFIALIPTNWIPLVKDLLSTEFGITLYWLIISTILLIIVTIIVVGMIFNKKIQLVKIDNHTDELTGLKNHKALKEYLEDKIPEFKSKNESLSLILIDIDDFKNFNTKFGYNTADDVLKKVGELLLNDKRVTDETFRQFLKGDEFLVVASDTNLNGATQAAERKRKLIQKALFLVGGKNHQITVSCGVTEFKKNSDDFISFTNRVTQALNAAKEVKGKNNTKSIV